MTLVHQAPASEELGKKISGLQRVVIEAIQPQIDCGRFPVKRVIGENVIVEADVFADGHDRVAVSLLYRFDHDPDWIRVPMRPVENDRWRAEFPCTSLGTYRYRIEAWHDALATWRSDLLKRIDAGQDISIDLLIGAELIEQAANLARGEDAERLYAWAAQLRHDPDFEHCKSAAMRTDLYEIARTYPDPRYVSRNETELSITVESERARFSAWYELFPRSSSREPGRHGTLRDVEERLDYIASMGFDVLYLPPIHPIGRAYRKGRNNVIAANSEDVGSPWAIGSSEGGHTSIHPELGTIEDFRRLVRKARDRGIDIALDLAYQASPDHPFVQEHREWFRTRPDGTIQYAENPPKKYQDIYPFDFSTESWPELWVELKSIVDFWINQGVRIFRVDNPHTKPFAFWKWLIEETKSRRPEVIFLAEAFTRPKVMTRLAKLGFSQSYTYFAWRNTKEELTAYFTEIANSVDWFRANLWPNTPDILTSFLQNAGPAAFQIRYLLAATLGASYGIYGPAFELMENQAREPGSEEYLHSEKYELKYWDLDAPESLRQLITRVNQIRKDNRALHEDRFLRFHAVDNPQLICYSKRDAAYTNVMLIIVNLDPLHRQWGFVDLDLPSLHIDSTRPYEVIDLLNGESYIWHGPRNYVELNPGNKTAHLFRMRSGA